MRIMILYVVSEIVLVIVFCVSVVCELSIVCGLLCIV